MIGRFPVLVECYNLVWWVAETFHIADPRVVAFFEHMPVEQRLELTALRAELERYLLRKRGVDYEIGGRMDGAGRGGSHDRGGRGPAGVLVSGRDSLLGDDVPVAEPAAGSAVAVPGEIVARKRGDFRRIGQILWGVCLERGGPGNS